MIKKQLKNSVTFLFIAYFLLAGGGYNVVNYCCRTCANEGIEAVATTSCSDIHNHTHSKSNLHQNSDITCTDFNHNHKGCHLIRLSIDTPSIITTQYLLVNSLIIIELFVNPLNLHNNRLLTHSQLTIHPPDGYLCTSGREIITNHAVLII